MSKGTGTPPFSAGQVIGHRYCLSELIDQGAMGAVWCALDVTTGMLVALKVVVRPDPDLRARFLLEARACKSIQHENVVELREVLQTQDGDPVLVMERLSGETLAALLQRKRRLSQDQAAAIGRDVARALAAAHEMSFVHRDIKPANIFLHDRPGAKEPVVKVLDFGVSKDLSGANGLETVVGGVVGSLMYMSPEQLRADRSIDGRSDIYSLGLVLYEMLAGVKPFGAESEVTARISVDAPAILHKNRRIHPELAAIVMACLDRNRQGRPWPASELARLLDQFAPPAPRTPVRTPTPPAFVDTAPLPVVPAPATAQQGAGGTILIDDDREATRRRPPGVPALPCPAPGADRGAAPANTAGRSDWSARVHLRLRDTLSRVGMLGTASRAAARNALSRAAVRDALSRMDLRGAISRATSAAGIGTASRTRVALILALLTAAALVLFASWMARRRSRPEAPATAPHILAAPEPSVQASPPRETDAPKPTEPEPLGTGSASVTVPSPRPSRPPAPAPRPQSTRAPGPIRIPACDCKDKPVKPACCGAGGKR